MRKKTRSPIFLLPSLFCLLLLFITAAGCSQGGRLAGTYVARIKGAPAHNEATLELKETGMGVWKVGENEVRFSWHVKGNEIRLYSKNGGVIIGRVDNRIIHITLPGSEGLAFSKVK